MQLSKRMQAIADLISPSDTLVDVGTDHGYIPIYMVSEHRVKKAIAMDVNPGPLQRAKDHIQEYGLDAYIETRLSDGVAALLPGEADVVVIAGMGGGLMQKILDEGKAVFDTIPEVILQPQSEIDKFRYYLADHGWVIEKEDMVCEDGKYYPMMRVRHGQMDRPGELESLYGVFLLKEKHPVLKEYLEKSYENGEKIQKRLYENGRDDTDSRVVELKKEMQNILSALHIYEM